MKTSATALLLAGCVAASFSPLVSADAPVNASSAVTSAPSSRVAANTSNFRPLDGWTCSAPRNNGVSKFWRLNKSDGPHDECTWDPLDRQWGMLASYRDGGIQNIHWKYTDNENDPECLKNWIYHAVDGRTVKARVPGRTTTYGLNRRWCGLPVYNDGGVQGYQWDYCDCGWVDPPYSV